jgi:WD40 repeat protein
LVVTSKIIGPNSVNTARFSRGDGLVITASPDGTARVWKTDSNHELWRNNEPSPPFGSSVVSGVGGADSVKLADGRTVKVEGEWLRVLDLLGHVAELRLTSPVQALRASGDRVLVIPSFESAANTKAVIIDVTSLRVVTQLDVGRGQVLGARFIDGGSRIATAANDGSVTIWSASTGAKELAITERTKFFDVDVSDKFVVAGASAGAVWIWDRSNGRPLWVLQAHRSAVNGIDLNGDKLVTRSFAGDSAGWSLRAQP